MGLKSYVLRVIRKKGKNHPSGRDVEIDVPYKIDELGPRYDSVQVRERIRRRLNWRVSNS